MKITIFGAGAVGGYLGALMSDSGFDVNLIARGDHLSAMRSCGLRLITPKTDKIIKVNAFSDSDYNDIAVKNPDFLLICVKSHTIADVVDKISNFIGENTCVISVINGIPWWYFYKTPYSHNAPLNSVDINGKIFNAIGGEKALGCVPYVGTEVSDAGVIKLFEGYNEFHLGEPDGSMSERLSAIAEVMTKSGIKTKTTDNIRYQVWRKLLGNITTNPISVLSNATMIEMASSEGMCNLIKDMMNEAMKVSESVGITLKESPEERVNVLGKLGDFKTSMLQDYESGKKLEINPIIGSVLEIASKTGVQTPLINSVYQLLKLLTKT